MVPSSFNLIFIILLVLLTLDRRQGLINLLFTDPLMFVLIAIALVFSLTVHEFSHAFSAEKLGDSTPRRYGRITLNPMAHLDPFGTLMMLIVGFGFAKPVPINPFNLGRWKTVFVAAAGPISNILIAILCALLLKVLPSSSFTDTVLMIVLSINVVLAVFNLLPIPLLDGSRIFGGIFPALGKALAQYEAIPNSFLLTLLLIYVLSGPINTLIAAVQTWVSGLVNL